MLVLHHNLLPHLQSCSRNRICPPNNQRLSRKLSVSRRPFVNRLLNNQVCKHQQMLNSAMSASVMSDLSNSNNNQLLLSNQFPRRCLLMFNNNNQQPFNQRLNIKRKFNSLSCNKSNSQSHSKFNNQLCHNNQCLFNQCVHHHHHQRHLYCLNVVNAGR